MGPPMNPQVRACLQQRLFRHTFSRSGNSVEPASIFKLAERMIFCAGDEENPAVMRRCRELVLTEHSHEAVDPLTGTELAA